MADPRGGAAAQTTLLSRRHISFLLYEWLGVEELCARERFAAHSRESFEDIIELAQRLAERFFAPHNQLADRQEPRIGADGRVVLVPEVRTALAAFADSGFCGITFDEAIGGFQLPHVVAGAALAWFHAANVGTTAYTTLTSAAANLIYTYGSPEQIDTWVPPMLDGRYHGTMCLSEPQAGSSLSDITTRAVRSDDGSYRVCGTKMWISGGEHELGENIVHLVLARTPDAPPGVKGISLFIVPRYGDDGRANDVALVGINHKMGFRGTVNTVLAFGEHGGAVGYLIGQEGHGLAYMFYMMNEARIAVGRMATCLGYTAYLKSLEYARERPQGRNVGADPTTPQLPIIEHCDIKRMLLAQKSYVQGALALVLYCDRLVDEKHTAPTEAERHNAATLLEILTPIAKSWPSQWCLAANDLAIQIHGGYGYTREYSVEQHYRDNRLNPIHEGTHGIQALDLLGRKVVSGDGAAFSLLTQTITATIDRALFAGGLGAELAGELAARVNRLIEATAAIGRESDRHVALANATAYLEATGHIVVAWIWLEQLLVSDDHAGPFYDGLRQTAKYFVRCELPRVDAQLDLVEKREQTALMMNDAWY